MIINQNQLLQKRFRFLLGRSLVVIAFLVSISDGTAQDTIFVCPQSEFIILANGFSSNYIDSEESEYLSDVSVFGPNSYFFLENSWNEAGSGVLFQIGVNSGDTIYIEQISLAECDSSLNVDPPLIIDANCDSTNSSFTATVPDALINWNEAQLISVGIDNSLTFFNSTVQEPSSDFMDTIPSEAATDGAIFQVLWSKGIVDPQLNITSSVDTLMFPEVVVFEDTVFACRSNITGTAPFVIINLYNYYNDTLMYEVVTIYESDSLGAMVDTPPDSGYSTGIETTLYFVLSHANPNCPADTALVDLIINEFPDFTPLSDSEICAGETIPIDSVTGQLPWIIEYNGVSIDVSTESITFDPVSETVTITSILITDALGCVNEFDLQETLFLHPIPAIVQIEDSICVNDPIEIVVSGGPITIIESEFFNPDDFINDTLTVLAPDEGVTITILGIANAHCPNEEDFSIQVVNLPFFELMDSLICGSSSLATINQDLLDSLITLENQVTSAWYFLDENPIVQDSTFSVSIDLILELENPTGCLLQDTVSIFQFESPVVSLWNDTLSACIGDTLDLTSIIPSIQVSYFDSSETQWTVHDAEGDLVPNSLLYFDPELGIYIESGDWESPLQITLWTDPPHPSCEQVVDSAYFSLNPLPEYTLISGACAGEGMFIEFESLSNSETLTYTWVGGSPVTISSGSPIPTEDTETGPTAELDLELVSDQGCVLVAQELVQIFPSPVISSVDIFGDTSLFVCVNDVDIPLQAFPFDFSAYFWDISGTSISSSDQNLDFEFIVDALSNSDSAIVTLSVHDSLIFMENSFVCVSEEYEFLLDLSLSRCEIREVYQFPGGLFVLEVENVNPVELNFVEWTIDGQDPLLGGAFVYLPSILNDPDAYLNVKTSLYGPNICTCLKSVETFGLVADFERSINAFPNPVIGAEVNILLPDVFLEKPCEFRLFTASSELVFSNRMVVSQPLTKLYFPSDLKGIFILEVVNKDFTIRSKLILE